MNILITSGSTTEFIDNVHFIGNVSDGSLGSIIGEEFSKQSFVEKVFYLCGKNARYPWQYSSSNDQKFFLDDWLDKVAVYHVDNAHHLSDTITDLFKTYKFDVVINLMSISNYGDTIFHLINDSKDAATLIKRLADDFGVEVEIKTPVGDTLVPINSNGKILSGYKRLFIEQKPTLKILKQLRELSSNTLIVSSKFDSGIDETDLIKEASDSLKKNYSDLVIAADFAQHRKSLKEVGYVVDKDRSYKRYESSDSIANALVEFVKAKKL